MRATIRDGDAIFVNVIAFDPTAVTALLALQDGDFVVLAGELTPKVYTPQAGEPRLSLDLLACAVVTEYYVHSHQGRHNALYAAQAALYRTRTGQHKVQP